MMSIKRKYNIFVLTFCIFVASQVAVTAANDKLPGIWLTLVTGAYSLVAIMPGIIFVGADAALHQKKRLLSVAMATIGMAIYGLLLMLYSGIQKSFF